MNYTDRGLTEITSGLAGAKALIARKRKDLQAQLGLIEADLSALGKIEAALDSSVEILRDEQALRAALAKAKEGATA